MRTGRGVTQQPSCTSTHLREDLVTNPFWPHPGAPCPLCPSPSLSAAGLTGASSLLPSRRPGAAGSELHTGLGAPSLGPDPSLGQGDQGRESPLPVCAPPPFTLQTDGREVRRAGPGAPPQPHPASAGSTTRPVVTVRPAGCGASGRVAVPRGAPTPPVSGTKLPRAAGLSSWGYGVTFSTCLDSQDVHR